MSARPMHPFELARARKAVRLAHLALTDFNALPDVAEPIHAAPPPEPVPSILEQARRLLADEHNADLRTARAEGYAHGFATGRAEVEHSLAAQSAATLQRVAPLLQQQEAKAAACQETVAEELCQLVAALVQHSLPHQLALQDAMQRLRPILFALLRTPITPTLSVAAGLGASCRELLPGLDLAIKEDTALQKGDALLAWNCGSARLIFTEHCAALAEALAQFGLFPPQQHIPLTSLPPVEESASP